MRNISDWDCLENILVRKDLVLKLFVVTHLSFLGVDPTTFYLFLSLNLSLKQALEKKKLKTEEQFQGDYIVYDLSQPEKTLSNWPGNVERNLRKLGKYLQFDFTTKGASSTPNVKTIPSSYPLIINTSFDHSPHLDPNIMI